MYIKDGKAIVTSDEYQDLKVRKQLYKSNNKDGILYRGFWHEIIKNDSHFLQCNESDYLDFIDQLSSYCSFYFSESDNQNKLNVVIKSGVKAGCIAAYIEYKPVKKWFIDNHLLGC